MNRAMASALRRGIVRLRACGHDRHGNINIIVALTLPVFLAVLGLGFEVTLWYMQERALQNAADSAAVAAAMNKDGHAAIEAKAVVAQYGFQDGVDGVSVTAATVPCPAGSGTCYRVAITKPTPLYLSRIVGFQGNITVNGQLMVALSSSATAQQSLKKREYCLVALAGLPGQSSSEGIRCNGCFMADLAGCSIMSNNTATCNGHNTLADVGDAYGINTGCGVQQNSYQPNVFDPYDALKTQLPVDPCGGMYPQKPANKSDPALPMSNLWSGDVTINGNVSVCGDLQLAGDTDISNTVGDGGVLIIWNGQLDTNDYKLQTVDGYLTIVFAGANGAYTHAPTGKGTLDFSAPRTGGWKGMAIYQAPTLTTGVDISEAGREPTWNVTGMVYAPHANVVFSGAINKSATNGEKCFGMVVDRVRINGTGFSLDDCGDAGLDLPYREVPGRGALVN